MKSFTEYQPEVLKEFFENDYGLVLAKSKILGKWEDFKIIQPAATADDFDISVEAAKNELRRKGNKYFSVFLTSKEKLKSILKKEDLLHLVYYI